MTTFLWAPGALPRAAWASASLAPTGTAVDTKSRSPQMTGVPAPRPGITFFHRMFLVSLHSTGGFASLETPVPSGPRHWGQYRSPSAADSARVEVMTRAARQVADVQNLNTDILRVFLRHACVLRFGRGRRGAAADPPCRKPPQREGHAGIDEKRSAGRRAPGQASPGSPPNSPVWAKRSHPRTFCPRLAAAYGSHRTSAPVRPSRVSVDRA